MNGPAASDAPPLLDTLGRPLRDLRISVTDRCNFRCGYCMPRDVFGPDFEFLSREEVLTFEEITRLARVFASPSGSSHQRNRWRKLKTSRNHALPGRVDSRPNE